MTDKPICKALCIAFLVMLSLPSSQRTVPPTSVISSKKLIKPLSKHFQYYNENNVPPVQLQKTPLNRKGILVAVPIC